VGLVFFVENRRILRVEPVEGLEVAHAQEGFCRLLEGRVHGVDEAGDLLVCEHGLDDADDEVLDVVHEVLELNEIQLSLDVGKLAQVPPRQRFFRPEALLYSGLAFSYDASEEEYLCSTHHLG
jgi:hypothetical protein